MGQTGIAQRTPRQMKHKIKQGITPTYSITELLGKVEDLEMALAQIREWFKDKPCTDCQKIQNIAREALERSRMT